MFCRSLPLWGISRQEDLLGDPQRVLGLSDLPAGNASALSEGSQKRLNVLSGSFVKGLVGQKTHEVIRPPYVEWRAIRRYPVFLRDPP